MKDSSSSRRTGRAFLAAAAFWALGSSAYAGPPITCGGVWAPGASEETLQRAFGAEQVRRGMIDVGEGHEEDGSIVYPSTPESTVLVLWKDPVGRRNPSSVRLRERTRQATFENIGIGTTLKTLERLNGRPFELAGFDFDYSGTVLSWLGGRLESIGDPACDIKVRLSPRMPKSPSGAQLAAREATVGERAFQSSDAKMQLLNPAVYEVLLNYR